MQQLHPSILLNIATYLPFHDLITSFEPLCMKTRQIVSEIYRDRVCLDLSGYSRLNDAHFINIMRRCYNILHLSLDFSENMVNCHQDMWEMNIYCPKLQVVVIHGSPVFASELCNQYVLKLVCLDGSTPPIYIDNQRISIYHMLTSVRIVFLVNSFHLHNSPIYFLTWQIMKYILAQDSINTIMAHLTVDQLVVCAFHAACKVYGVSITFQNMLDVYTLYFQSFQNAGIPFLWKDAASIWFNINISGLGHEQHSLVTMVDLYNLFFVPFVLPIIQKKYPERRDLYSLKSSVSVTESLKELTIVCLMNFCEAFPLVYYNPDEYFSTSKNIIHKTANLGNDRNNKASGRIIIEEKATLHSEKGMVIIDQDTFIGKGVHIYPSTKCVDSQGNESLREYPQVRIGKNVILNENVMTFASSIGSNVYIGKNCILGEGCIIKDNCVLEDNSVLPPYSVVAPYSQLSGDPCQLVCELPFSFYYQMKNYCSTIFEKYIPCLNV